MKPKTCLIVGAGEFTETALPYKDGDLLIAADGGFAYLKRLGLTPDLVIGDFDSLGYTPAAGDVHKLSVDKALSDMHEAALLGISHGCQKFMLFGGCGGRFDHTLANIQLLAYLTERGMQATLYETHQRLTMVKGPGSITLARGSGDGLSVFAYTPVCRGVTERGVKYAVQEYVPDGIFTNDYPTGVSNRFVEKEATIGVSEGTLLLVWDR